MRRSRIIAVACGAVVAGTLLTGCAQLQTFIERIGAGGTKTITLKTISAAELEKRKLVKQAEIVRALTRDARERAGVEVRGYDIVDPASVAVIVNRQRPINPLDYVPSDMVQPGIPNHNGDPLRKDVAKAIAGLYAETVASTGVGFKICSGYRSFETQRAMFDAGVAANGREQTEKYIARPGYSEHQLGVAVDIGDLSSDCAAGIDYSQTVSGKYFAENAHRYGFVLRYAHGTEAILGAGYEWWHWRYVGVPIATDMYNLRVKTLEEFFGTGAAPSYAD